jgi:hypothetical protein
LGLDNSVKTVFSEFLVKNVVVVGNDRHLGFVIYALLPRRRPGLTFFSLSAIRNPWLKLGLDVVADSQAVTSK